MYVSFGKRVCDIVVGLVALPFVLLIIAVLAPFIHFVTPTRRAPAFAELGAPSQERWIELEMKLLSLIHI